MACRVSTLVLKSFQRVYPLCLHGIYVNVNVDVRVNVPNKVRFKSSYLSKKPCASYSTVLHDNRAAYTSRHSTHVFYFSWRGLRVH